MPKSREEAKRNAIERRQLIRDYIRNQRDPIVLKWKALGESVKLEDYRRAQFAKTRVDDDTVVLPIIVRKFIGSLRRAVRTMVRNKGGTPYSVIRNLFFYWDADKKGYLTAQDLKKFMNSLGIKATDEDRQAIVQYYDVGQGLGQMSYNRLLHDLDRGEPTLIEFNPKEDEEVALRFVEVADSYKETPPLVQHFLEAFRHYVARKMRIVGGTPQEHVHAIILKFDKDVTGALNAQQLVRAAHNDMKLTMTDEQAAEIIRFYDRRGRKELETNLFVSDVCRGVQSILHFSELSAEAIAQQKKALECNPFIVKPFHAKPNKTLEKVKQEIINVLNHKVSFIGGSKKGWLKEAFRFWDPRDLGVITKWEHLQGAVKRLGLQISQEESECLMNEYDTDGSGNLNYNIMIADVVEHDPHFMEDASEIDAKNTQKGRAQTAVTSRAPRNVARNIQNFKKAVEAYSRKSGGLLEARDVLHGTFLRFDRRQNGRVELESVAAVCAELGVVMTPPDLSEFAKWFDTNGSDTLDYNELTRQLFGDDIMTRKLRLPKVPHAEMKAQVLASTTKPAAYHGLGSSAISTMALGMGSNSPSKFGETSMATIEPTIHGQLKVRTLLRNLMDIESRDVREAKKAARQKVILEERSVIQQKLASIEKQRRKVLEDYRLAKLEKEQELQHRINLEKMAARQAQHNAAIHSQQQG